MKPTISVIVPNYEGKKIFPDCVRSLLKQRFKNFEIVFVDDGSSDGSYGHAKKLFGRYKNVTITKTPRNAGYVGACNHAFKKCRGTYITTVNNDATFPKNWLDEMYRAVKGKKKAIGSSLIIDHRTPKLLAAAKKRQKFPVGSLIGVGGLRPISDAEDAEDLVQVPYAGILLVPRTALQGYIFRKTYFAYGEDIELCFRLRLRGYKIYANRKAKMQHIGSYTRHKVASFNKKAIFHGTKNSIENFFVMYNPYHTLVLLPPYTLMQVVLFLSRPKELWYRLKGLFWVLAHIPTVVKHRKDVQRKRTVDDDEMFGVMTYKIREPSFTNGLQKAILRVANTTMLCYTRLFGIRTADNYKN